MTYKLDGPYIPCKTQCGAPEPCFGCDIGDYAEPRRPAAHEADPNGAASSMTGGNV